MPISAKVVANLLQTVGVARVLTMDLHADQIQGFFDIPVDNIYASPVLLGDLRQKNYEDLIVVSPDVGGVVRARALACTRCPHLVSSRTQVVFGVGNPEARLMFVGEAPGADEDYQGEPFVGLAGQLHHALLHLMLWEGLTDIAYIAAHTTGFEALRDRVREFTPAHAAKVGEAAPAFTGTDSQGQAVSLAQYKGKFVVLEWHNHDCPYVKKHYGSGNLPKLQKEWTKKGVVWLAIVSSAPGKQGNVDGATANANMKAAGAAPTATLLDPKGDLGRLYGAKTTPHMYVINPAGTLVYAGAIDDKRSTKLEDVKTAKNYLVAALDESKAGKPVSTATTQPYGCSVKYK